MKLPERDLCRLCKKLPAGLLSKPIQVSLRPHLKAQRGKLLSGLEKPGKPVYAASFIRRREIVLETQLLARPNKLKLILIHEIFHFVWAYLGSRRRAEFALLIEAEKKARARGELGESAEVAKLSDAKDYVCESFCDTGAWLYSGVKTSQEFTLALRWQNKRRAWFLANFNS